jgi:NAD(P)-dependent dehydrogenase (short-subunit alcohol dehydrogenase family)
VSNLPLSIPVHSVPANPMDLTGRRLLVTGAASGIGQATAVLLSRLGAKVACVDINQRGLEETAALLHSDGHNLQVRNLKDLNGIPGWMAELVDGFGLLHGFVHAAGIPAPWTLRTASVDGWRDAFLINTEAALALTKAFHGRKIYAGDSGSIVFVSSVMGQVGTAPGAVYSMTKGALNGMARSLAIELAGRKIRVNCVAPAFVKTPMFDEVEQLWNAEQKARVEEMHPLGIGQPVDIANAVAFLLADTARWITGTVLVVDGGYTAQ